MSEMKDEMNKPLILIVDDNEQNLQVLGKLLQLHPYRLALARNGAAALEFVRRKQPDLILLDIMMPEMDGITVCEKIREEFSGVHLPVIFLTALSETEDKLRAFAAGGVDYITKPFVKEEVFARIDVHLRLKQTLEQLEAMSVTDQMTGVYNRRFAYRMIQRELSSAARKETPFVICFLDIDNLKIANDTQGHEAGDRLIMTVVEAVRSGVRDSDMIFRMGGDEFVVLLPEAVRSDAEQVFVRIRERLSGVRIGELPVVFSVGFREIAGGTRSEDIDRLLDEADAEMYREKKQHKAAAGK